MPRHRIRHQRGQPFIFFKGEPGALFRPGSYRLVRGGFWVSKAHLRYVKEKAREERRAQRLANQTKFGKGSGKAGGGRGAAHSAHHRRYLNRHMGPNECPLCYHRKLWTLWIRSDFGRWKDVWEEWIETELVRLHLAKLKLGERKSLLRDPFELHCLKEFLLKNHPKKVAELKGLLDDAAQFFDTYLSNYRFEHTEDFSIFVTCGATFEYTSTHQQDSLPNFGANQTAGISGDLSDGAIQDVLTHESDFLRKTEGNEDGSRSHAPHE
jgi:hypothetical protein